MSQLLQGKTAAYVDSVIAPKFFWNGIGMDAILEGAVELAIDTVSAIDHYNQGLPITAEGRIAAEFAAPVRFNNGAMPLTAIDRLAVAEGPPADFALAANGYRLAGELILA